MGGLRVLWHAQIDHPTGIVDVFNTHLAAGIDLQPCGDSCPQECRDAGAATSRECQGVQIARLTQERAAPNSLRVLGGDFNSNPQSFVYHLRAEKHGWTDTYKAAGNPECDPATGIGCTSGRQDEDLSDMESPASGERSRIDYLFVSPGLSREVRRDSATVYRSDFWAEASDHRPVFVTITPVEKSR
jgi:endonuclease/exonuclease/phosphatase family metal-dependent hydrolase